MQRVRKLATVNTATASSRHFFSSCTSLICIGYSNKFVSCLVPDDERRFLPHASDEAAFSADFFLAYSDELLLHDYPLFLDLRCAVHGMHDCTHWVYRQHLFTNFFTGC